MCRPTKATASRARLRWRPAVRKRGQAADPSRSEVRMPSTTTAVSSSVETAPAPLVVYQSSVSLTAQEPPVTACAVDDELARGVLAGACTPASEEAAEAEEDADDEDAAAVLA